MLEDLIEDFVWWNRPFHAFEVFPNLFQGSGIRCKEDIKKVYNLSIQTIIDLEGGFDPPMSFLESYLYWPISDTPWLPDIEYLFMVANYGALLNKNGKRVLVHCKYGLNRSGLVCGRIMNLRGEKGPEILKAITEKIHGALWNPALREYIMGL